VVLHLALDLVRTLRHGGSPADRAALYTEPGAAPGLETLKEGAGLSWEDVLDLGAAARLAGRLQGPGFVIVRHTRPWGAAVAETTAAAWTAASHADPASVAGSTVACNRPLDLETARLLAAQRLECVAAPAFEPAAVACFACLPSTRLVRLDVEGLALTADWEARLVGPWGLLSRGPGGPAPEWRVVTERGPTIRELQSLRFAWEIVGAALPDAVAIARGAALIALGSAQANRGDAVDMALLKARRAGHDLRDAVLASDGPLPGADDLERAAEAGITAFVQPGGDPRDEEVIGACDRRGLAMLFTDRGAGG
jgi:phosphoribosylaminoimidazolecarboxamide formyltransferase/IMP cyclohydrolase